MTNPQHILKENQKIVHIGHRHEHPILDLPIEIIANTDDILVVNKPPSIPVHACGQFKANTVLARLKAEQGFHDLRGKPKPFFIFDPKTLEPPPSQGSR